MFNSFKTMIRALQQQGHGITFTEVVTMLHGEDIQLLQESTTPMDSGSVLVATHGQGKLSVGSTSTLSAHPLSTVSTSYNDLSQS